jgi:two-component system chemotaxis response regulator CheY
MKVLLVDDNEDIRLLMRAILESRGHTVAGEAGDGDAAIKAFKELRPDAVLLDIIMPGKSGVAALEELRALDKDVKIVMVTAVGQDEVNRSLLLMGASGIIYKPFSAADFDSYFETLPAKKPAGAAPGGAIRRLAAEGLSKCLLRAADATASAWELFEVSVAPGREADLVKLADMGRDTAAVQVNLRGSTGFSAALVFHADNSGFIANTLVKGPLYRIEEDARLEESLMLEMGNIIENSLANVLFNALKVSAIPSVPILVKGGPAAVAAALMAFTEPGGPVRLVSAKIAMQREGRLTKACVLAVLPEALAIRLDAVDK